MPIRVELIRTQIKVLYVFEKVVLYVVTIEQIHESQTFLTCQVRCRERTTNQRDLVLLDKLVIQGHTQPRIRCGRIFLEILEKCKETVIVLKL